MASETRQAGPRRQRRRVAWAGGLAAAYLAMALVSVWPLPTRLGSVLSQGTDRAATVPLFQAWSMWWVSDRLANGFSGIWDAPIFHPTRTTFLFSDPMLLVGIIGAPVIWVGGSPALAYNLLLLLALLTNGLFGYGLLRCAGQLRPVAASGYDLVRSMGHRVLVIESSWLEANTGCAPPGGDWLREVRFDALDVEIWRSTAEATPRDVPARTRERGRVPPVSR